MLLTLQMAAGIAVAAAFNLTCPIAFTGLTGEMIHRPSTPMEVKLRVDLTTSRFCSGNCTQTEGIAKTTPVKIYFRMHDEPMHGEYLAVSRESGDFMSITKFGRIEETQTGTCTVGAFTGFPSRKF